MSDEITETPSGLARIAERLGFSPSAARHLMQAMESGGGRMAQFDHPELGGLGQWSAGGMLMIGRMFDSGLKGRVAALCDELARARPEDGWTAAGAPAPASWWPAGLGRPSTSGAQNAMRYAYFPEARRLAVESAGRVALYDTGAHEITGASQQQGPGQTLRFTDRSGGVVDLDALTPADVAAPEPAAPEPAAPDAHAAQPRPFEPEPLPPFSAPPAAHRAAETVPAGGPAADILATIERLSDMHRKGVLTESEFSAKKADLLSRL